MTETGLWAATLSSLDQAQKTSPLRVVEDWALRPPTRLSCGDVVSLVRSFFFFLISYSVASTAAGGPSSV